MTSPSTPDEAADAPVPSRRERARAATIAEIKQTALQLMHEHGTTDLRFADIARAMGMTAPALYRYFNDRDELLTAMIVDAYRDLGATVASSRESVPRSDPGGRLLAVARAYREWAYREPQQFALILGMPVPGYVAPEEGPTTEAAINAMGELKALFFEAQEQGLLGKPMINEVSNAVRESCAREAAAAKEDRPPPPEIFQAMLHCWSSLHGFVSLETYGHLDFLTPEARDAVFATNLEVAAVAAGLPTPGSTVPGGTEVGSEPPGGRTHRQAVR